MGRDAAPCPEIGARILAEVEDYADVARVVRSHHERWDGAGYPDRLSGHAIPRHARIIAVADSYNAMTTDRPYRAAMSTARAIQQLELGKGTQFESPVVDAFLAVLERETELYQRGRMPDFLIEAQRHSVIAADEGPHYGHECRSRGRLIGTEGSSPRRCDPIWNRWMTPTS